MPPKVLPFEPMLCETAEQPPDGPEWRYELKLDGYRAIGFKTDGQVQLWLRNGKDFVRRFPEVAKAIFFLGARSGRGGSRPRRLCLLQRRAVRRRYLNVGSDLPLIRRVSVLTHNSSRLRFSNSSYALSLFW
jgi:hypothetical protein